MKTTAFFFLGLALQGWEARAQEQAPLPASCSKFPTTGQYGKDVKLPDPFLKADGTRVQSKEEWACKRDEIRQQFQKLELGVKPPKPTVKATMSGSTISITCSEGGKSISFSVTIKAPSGSAAAASRTRPGWR